MQLLPLFIIWSSLLRSPPANLLLEEAQNREGINYVRRVIDFSFQYVEGLIRLNGGNAQEAISHSGHSGCRD